MLRESGLLDVLVNSIYRFYKSTQKLLAPATAEQREPVAVFVTAVIEFLRIASERSYANSVYILQWYSVFRELIKDADV